MISIDSSVHPPEREYLSLWYGILYRALELRDFSVWCRFWGDGYRMHHSHGGSGVVNSMTADGRLLQFIPFWQETLFSGRVRLWESPKSVDPDAVRPWLSSSSDFAFSYEDIWDPISYDTLLVLHFIDDYNL